MAISNGSVIAETDVNTFADSALADLESDNTAFPCLHWLNLKFDNIVSGTLPPWTVRNVVIPDDSIIAEVCITGGEHNGTITLTIDNGAMITPISITATLGANYVKASRYYLTPTAPLQLLMRGSTLTATLTTTNAVTPTRLQVAIGLKSERRRA